MELAGLTSGAIYTGYSSIPMRYCLVWGCIFKLALMSSIADEWTIIHQ